MPKYSIDTFRAGISDESDKGVRGSYKFGYGLDIHGRDDVLTCKQAMATIFGASNTTQTGIIRHFVNSSDGSTYCFGSTGSVFARSGDGDWTFVYNDSNGEIRGAAEWGHSDGTKYLYWATATSIARKPINGADVTRDSGTARWTDVTQDYKTTLENVTHHTMKNSSGQLNIANGNSLAVIDYVGNFDALALNIRPGNLIKAIDERDDYTILGSYRSDVSEEGHIWSWITTATTWIQKKRIPVQGINALINTEIMLLQGGENGELFFSDFTNATPLNALNGGGEVNPGGVDIENDLAVFGFYGGTYPGIWSYGRRMKNRPYAMNFDYRMAKTVDGSTVTEIGAVKMADGTLLASWATTDGSTIEYGIDSVSSTTKASAVFEGLEFTGGDTSAKKKFDTVKLVFDPLVSGTSLSVKCRLDKVTSWSYAVLASGSTTFSVADANEAIFSIGNVAKIYEVGVELTPTSNSSPNIHLISTYIGEEKYDY